MTSHEWNFELGCKACGWSELCSTDQIIERLRAAGKLRRNAKPDRELVESLLTAEVAKWSCPHCSRAGIGWWAPADNQADWPGDRRCDGCGAAIDRERLELFPNTRYCVACQRAEESGQSAPDYCPRCGGIMQVRATRGTGITRYELVCMSPACRHTARR